MTVETVHGVLRGLFLAPLVGDFRARQIGVFVGSLLILGITAWTIRWITGGPPDAGGTDGKRFATPAASVLFRIGALWTALTLAFEFGLGRALGRTWTDLLSDYDIAHGGLLLIGIAVLFCAPWVAARWRLK